MITDIAKQVERWGEQFSELYSRENVVVASALDAIEHLPTMEELDAIPTLGELGKAIDSLTCAKAPGNDGIPQTWSGTARPPFCSLYTTPFPSVRVKVVFHSQDTRDAKIVTLNKKKGDKSDCNNLRGISLLSIMGKLYGRVLLVHPQELVERVYPESQYGFRAERSTEDMILSFRQL